MNRTDFDAVALNVDRDCSEHIDSLIAEYAAQFPELPADQIAIAVLAGGMGGIVRSLLTAADSNLVRDSERKLTALLQQTADVWRQLRSNPVGTRRMQ